MHRLERASGSCFRLATGCDIRFAPWWRGQFAGRSRLGEVVINEVVVALGIRGAGFAFETGTVAIAATTASATATTGAVVLA